jgi:hypothetical protein
MELRLWTKEGVDFQFSLPWYMQQAYGNYGADSKDVYRIVWYLGAEPCVVLCGVVTQDRFISLPRAPFGGFYVCKSISKGQQLSILTTLRHFLQERSIRTVEMHQPPAAYGSVATPLSWSTAAENVGFLPIATVVRPHYMLYLEGIDIPYANYHTTPMRKLKKLESAGYYCKVLDWDAELFRGALHRARSERGYPLLFTSEMARQVDTNPKQYLWAGCFLGEQMAAMGLLVRVTSEVLYYAQPADFEPFRSDSPLLALQAFLNNWALSNGFIKIDLGAAVKEGGRESPGLRQYKQSIGGKADNLSFFQWGVGLHAKNF